MGGPEVRERAFEAVADFDADFAIFERDKEEDAIIGPLPPKLPGGGDAMGKLFERIAFERRQNQDGHLIAGFRLVGFEVLGE